MPNPLLAGTAAFFLTAAGLAVAQEMPPPPGGAMMRADTNGDGVVTRQEVIDQATKRFDRLDRNRDGKLDASEMPRPGLRGMGGDMPPPLAPPKP